MRSNSLRALAATALLALGASAFGADGKPQPTAAVRKAAEAIRRECLLPPNGPQGRPLPLVSHWNMGGQITDSNEKFLQMVGYSREDLESGLNIMLFLGGIASYRPCLFPLGG